MSHDVTLRTMALADFDTMYAISLAAHAKGYRGLINPDRYEDFIKRYSYSDVKKKKYIKRHNVFVSTQNGFGLVAYDTSNGGPENVLGYVVAEYHAGAGVAELKGLFVSPACQGRGIGRRLFEAMVDTLVTSAKTQDSKVLDIFLNVIEANQRARSLYESFGFKETKEQAGSYYGADLIRMMRPRELTVVTGIEKI